MGADLGGQNTLGQILLDYVLVKIGFQLLGLQVEFNPAGLGAFTPVFVVFLRLGHPMRRQYFNPAAIFFGEVITQFFFQFLGVGDLFHGLGGPAGQHRKIWSASSGFFHYNHSPVRVASSAKSNSTRIIIY